MKIGIFGGSFNPPHNMHKDIVLELLKQDYLDKIICIPTGDNYAKSCLLPIKDRIEMLKLMFKGNEKVNISAIELDGSLYTWDTMNFYQKKYPYDELFFICGMDNLAELSTWHRYEDILKKFKLVVIKRDTDEDDAEAALELYENYKDRIEVANVKARKISSTFVRNEILKEGVTEELKDSLDLEVIEYIKNIDYGKYWNVIK